MLLVPCTLLDPSFYINLQSMFLGQLWRPIRRENVRYIESLPTKMRRGLAPEAALIHSTRGFYEADFCRTKGIE